MFLHTEFLKNFFQTDATWMETHHHISKVLQQPKLQEQFQHVLALILPISGNTEVLIKYIPLTDAWMMVGESPTHQSKISQRCKIVF